MADALTDKNEAITARIITSLKEIEPAQWDACAAGLLVESDSQATESPSEAVESNTQPRPGNPFVSHAFLSSLEDSGSVGPRTGWNIAHVLIEDDAGQLVAAAPSYLKTHSQGEYVFDHSWAEAYGRAGGRYFPKVQVSVPFTPATGPRLLVRGGEGADQHRAGLAGGLEALRREAKASSIHVTFAAEPDVSALANAGFIERHDIQFHWQNDGYRDYEDFLGRFASRKRKALKKERREAVSAGIEIVWLTGSDLTEAIWDAFFAFYTDTGSRKWGRPYLTREFFSLIGGRMPDQIMLAMARREGRWIAGAINFLGDDCLYGRNWGCIEDHPFLHFELCYNQAVELAIARGLKRVEAGAQGEHKLARGYLPIITRSMHAIADPGLARPVADFVVRERAGITAYREELLAQSPFKAESVTSPGSDA
ncbi:MAG: GNAT family N-acetyltransferase [Bosea sp. (in: a-proteobacteria)]